VLFEYNFLPCYAMKKVRATHKNTYLNVFLWVESTEMT